LNLLSYLALPSHMIYKLPRWNLLKNINRSKLHVYPFKKIRPLINSTAKIPFYKSIQAGHPDISQDISQEGSVDINQLLVKSSSLCYFLFVENNQYEDFGFELGDLLILHKEMPFSFSDVVLYDWKKKPKLSFFSQSIKSIDVYAVVTAVIKFKKPLLPKSFRSIMSEQDEFSLDLNVLIEHPNHSFLLEVEGESMLEAGIEPGDLVLTDALKEPKKQDIVVARLHGGFTLKYYSPDHFNPKLRAANKSFKDIDIPYDEDFKVISVVTAVIQIRKKI